MDHDKRRRWHLFATEITVPVDDEGLLGRGVYSHVVGPVRRNWTDEDRHDTLPAALGGGGVVLDFVASFDAEPTPGEVDAKLAAEFEVARDEDGQAATPIAEASWLAPPTSDEVVGLQAVDGDKPRTSALPQVVIATEPVSWDELAVEHDLDGDELAFLMQLFAEKNGSIGTPPGSIEVACRVCKVRCWLPPVAQAEVFRVGAWVICAGCAITLTAHGM